MSFFVGGFISVINILLLLRFWFFSASPDVLTFFLLCLLILGCFMGRESGIMGHNWKKKIESFEKSEYERKTAQKIVRNYS